MAGIYVHIPFCQKKCLYCDFYSVVSGGNQMARFVEAVQVEARKRAYELEGMVVDTIYFGGGTPSLLFHKEIGAILDTLREVYDVAPNAEVTMECNPGDVSQMEVAQLVHYGVNRMSIGAQTFQPELLQRLGRRHSVEETRELWGYLRSEGITNLSLDLIYSIPGEDLGGLKRDLDCILELNPEHISAYDLIYEQGTPLYNMRAKGEIRELPEELSLQMAHEVRTTLKNAGYEQYEVSNYARPGYRSRHNTSYWKGTPYIGLGPAAHSYRHPWRSWNAPSLEEYNSQLLHNAGFLVRTYEWISPEMAYEEYFLTRLRTNEGIDLSEMNALGFRIPQAAVEQCVADGLLQRQGDRFALSEKGLDYADRVILNLVNN
ncbi:radical SAM family heme chaperone HemW [Porphyromonas levii]|uniref:radical SAM family heme chaperone HemW n=1 Tax=Porphyromonas levii TaxID=28114 RepID=UPI001B8CBB7C|nr:radical SAM family heme chaperone HemW [Porphyromonas levii]MBR8759449.1 Heme chaperone HemW [Porphyromonas levii]